MHTLIDYQVFCSNTPLRRFTYSKCSLKLHRERTNSSLTQAGDIQHTFNTTDLETVFWNPFYGFYWSLLNTTDKLQLSPKLTFLWADMTSIQNSTGVFEGFFLPYFFFRNWLEIILEKFKQDCGRRDPCNCLCRAEHSPSALWHSQTSVKGSHTIPFPEWSRSILNQVEALKSVLQPILQ